MKKKTEKQIKILKEKANLGDSASLHELAFYHQAGMYVEQDFSKAMKLWKLAAKKGYGPAYHNLVSMYFNGLGVTPNYRKAYEYLHLSVKKKHHLQAKSLSFLAQRFYFDGLLKKRDIKKGIKYYKKAAIKLNDTYSQFMLASMYDPFFDIEPGIKKDNKLSFQFHNMAAKNNFVPSIFRIAMEYMKGEIVKKNNSLAIKLFKEGSKIKNLDLIKSFGLLPHGEAGVIRLSKVWKNFIKKELKKNKIS